MTKRGRFQPVHVGRLMASRADDLFMARALEATTGRTPKGQFAKAAVKAVVVTETRQQRRHAARMAAKKGGEPGA